MEECAQKRENKVKKRKKKGLTGSALLEMSRNDFADVKALTNKFLESRKTGKIPPSTKMEGNPVNQELLYSDAILGVNSRRPQRNCTAMSSNPNKTKMEIPVRWLAPWIIC